MNLFDDLPRQADEELFTELLSRKGVRIERIVSTGQSTPAGEFYNQEFDEWVLLVSGSAGLWIEGDGERDLGPGDYALPPYYPNGPLELAAERLAESITKGGH
jgi:cupin 2 domain-containing protein